MIVRTGGVVDVVGTFGDNLDIEPGRIDRLGESLSNGDGGCA